jgi:hypothetical protein
VAALAEACRGRYGELVYVLAFQGLRWGELAGLQVADRVMVPGRGLRLSRAVLASNGGGKLYIDTLKNKRARTVPLVPVVVPIVDRWSIGKRPSEWLFAAPEGGPLRETNWKRSVGWYQAKAAIGRPELRVLSRPGAQCRCCHRSVSPSRSPNPSCQSLGNGLSTVAAVRRGSWVARGWGSDYLGRCSEKRLRPRSESTRPRPLRSTTAPRGW